MGTGTYRGGHRGGYESVLGGGHTIIVQESKVAQTVRRFLPTDAQELQMISAMAQAGAWDEGTGRRATIVDGLTHIRILREIRMLIVDEFDGL